MVSPKHISLKFVTLLSQILIKNFQVISQFYIENSKNLYLISNAKDRHNKINQSKLKSKKNNITKLRNPYSVDKEQIPLLHKKNLQLNLKSVSFHQAPSPETTTNAFNPLNGHTQIEKAKHRYIFQFVKFLIKFPKCWSIVRLSCFMFIFIIWNQFTLSAAYGSVEESECKIYIWINPMRTLWRVYNSTALQDQQ